MNDEHFLVTIVAHPDTDGPDARPRQFAIVVDAEEAGDLADALTSAAGPRVYDSMLAVESVNGEVLYLPQHRVLYATAAPGRVVNANRAAARQAAAEAP